jgi:methylmalonyl-CoA mutase N-terminal domain/subunit
MDEALALPTENAVRIALRTQQILAHESGVADTADPLGGSFAVERLTRDLEEEAEAYIRRIDDMGGSVAAIDFMQREIQDAAYRYQREVEERARIVVGVNEFVAAGGAPSAVDGPPAGALFQVDPGVGQALRERVIGFRAGRERDRAARALEALDQAARGKENLMPVLVEAVDAGVTLGEICERLRAVFGIHQPSVAF